METYFRADDVAFRRSCFASLGSSTRSADLIRTARRIGEINLLSCSLVAMGIEFYAIRGDFDR